jgi:3-mercaptopyruvate sulfurtransferase SseA
MCESEVRSAYAAMFLRGYGFSGVKTLDHGMYIWRMGGGPVVAGTVISYSFAASLKMFVKRGILKKVMGQYWII